MTTTIEQIHTEINRKNSELETTYDVQIDGPHTGDADFILKPAKKWIHSILEDTESKNNIAQQIEEMLDSDELFYCYFSDSIREILFSIISSVREQNWKSAIENIDYLSEQVKYLEVV